MATKKVTNRTDGVGWDRARFYTIEGLELPSVTTILGIIDKSGPLMGWAVNMERKAFETAILDVLSRPGAHDPEWVLTELAPAVTGAKAMLKEKDKAANIGTAIHAGIEWHLRTQMGEDPGPYPLLPDAAVWGVESWKDWMKASEVEPLAIERQVHCLEPTCFYAGTLDLYARVKGVLTVLDWKSSKAIYPEAFLQNIAYRHAADRLGMPSAQGLIVRLPKVESDPGFEVTFVPEVTLAEFQAAVVLWRTMRRLEGKRAGAVPRPVRLSVNPKTGEW